MNIYLSNRLKLDTYLLLIVLLIVVVFNYPSWAFVPGVLVLICSYVRILLKGDLTSVIILMLISRLIMGPLLPGNATAFNILNLFCNYIPPTIVIIKTYGRRMFVSKSRLVALKWTISFVIFMVTISLFNLKYSLSVFPQEILPIILFLVFVIIKEDQKIDFEYLILFFRYTFVACILIYIMPDFGSKMQDLFAKGIIFKESLPDISLFVKGTIPRNTGFVFDFRIMGQLACIYFLLLYYKGKKQQIFDVVLLIVVAIITFSRGPIIILALIIFAAYLPERIKLTKSRLVFFGGLALLSLTTLIYVVFSNNIVLNNYLDTYNPFSKNNAISQRGMFIKYSLNKFYESPLGNGLGSLSSPKADNKIFAGYTNSLHKEIPDKVYYYRVTDAFLVMTLAELGIIGFFLFLLSIFEIFFSYRNRVSLFFIIALFINLIGTDIPKQGFFYFAIAIVYYGISQKEREKSLLIGAN